MSFSGYSGTSGISGYSGVQLHLAPNGVVASAINASLRGLADAVADHALALGAAETATHAAATYVPLSTYSAAITALQGFDSSISSTVNTINSNYLAKGNNLSELTNAATARTNLGLGTAATLNTGTSLGNVPVLSTGGSLLLSGGISGTTGGFSLGVTVGQALGVTGNATFGGTLGITGAMSGSSGSFSGALTAYSLTSGPGGITAAGAFSGTSGAFSGNVTVSGLLTTQGSGAGITVNGFSVSDNSGNLRGYSLTIPSQMYVSSSVGSTGSLTFGGHDAYGTSNMVVAYNVTGNTSQTTFTQTTPSNNGQRSNEYTFQGENTFLNVINVNDGVGVRFGWGWYAGRIGYGYPNGNYGWVFALDGTNVGTIVPQVNSIGPVTYRTLIDDGSGRVAINWTSAPTAFLDINSDVVRVRVSKTPATSSATGNVGDSCWDANYEYRCVATNTWKRAALTTW